MHTHQNADFLWNPDESYPQITTRNQRRAGHIFGHSPSSSTSSSSASSIISEDDYVHVQKPKTNLITNLLSPIIKRTSPTHRLSPSQTLRLRAIPDTKPNARLASTLLHIQPPSLSPISPTFSIDFEKKQATLADVRLKRIHKLAKTFGEEVPPELVFPDVEPVQARVPTPLTSVRPLPKIPSGSSPSHSPTGSTSSAPTLAERRRRHRPRSLSLGSGTDALATNAARFIVENTLQATKEDQSRPEPPRSESTPPTKPCSHAKSCRELALQSMTIKDKALVNGYGLPQSPPPFQTKMTMVPVADDVSSAHLQADTDVSRPPTRAALSRQHSRSSSHLPLSADDLVPNFSYPTELAFSLSRPSEYGYRREREWSGEWNLRDMQDIVKGLRDLKTR